MTLKPWILGLFSFSSLALLTAPVDAKSVSSITEGVVNVNDGSMTQPVTYIKVNPKDPHVVIQSSLASNHLGSVTSLASLDQAVHGVAAINGTLFNSYSDQFPTATIVNKGQFEHLGGPTVLAINKDGTAFMNRVTPSVMIHFTQSNGEPYQLYPWGLNSVSHNANEIEILTSVWGKTTNLKDSTALVVQNGHITSIQNGNTTIPNNGYVIAMGNSSYNAMLLTKVSVGDPISYTVTMSDMTSKQPVDFSNVETAIGSGPLLVDKGKIALNPSLEHLTDSSFIKPVTRRSFVGIDTNGNIIFATVKFANLSQLAQIAYRMHLVEAMNLDGGSSSGLYYNGKYLLQPGRSLSNAIVVSLV